MKIKYVLKSGYFARTGNNLLCIRSDIANIESTKYTFSSQLLVLTMKPYPRFKSSMLREEPLTLMLSLEEKNNLQRKTFLVLVSQDLPDS